MKEEYFPSKLKNKCSIDEEIERTKKIISLFANKKGEELIELNLKSDVTSRANVFAKFVKVSIEEFDINPLYCVSLPSYTYQCALKIFDIKLRALQNKVLILILENKIHGGISSVMGNR